MAPPEHKKKREKKDGEESGEEKMEDDDLGKIENPEIPKEDGARRTSSISEASNDSLVSVEDTIDISTDISDQKADKSMDNDKGSKVGFSKIDQNSPKEFLNQVNTSTDVTHDVKNDAGNPSGDIPGIPLGYPNQRDIKSNLDNRELAGNQELSPGLRETPNKIKPLVYLAPSFCDKGIKMPNLFKTGQIPEILITKAEPAAKATSRDIPEITNELIPEGMDSLRVPLDSHNQRKSGNISPLIYKVDCLCDRIEGGNSDTSIPNASIRSSDSLTKALNLAEKDPSFWPKGTPSNQNTWENLPVKQIVSKKDTKEGNRGRDQVHVVRKTQSATATLDPVTPRQSNEVTRPVTQAVRLTSGASKGNSKLSQGATRADFPRGIQHARGCAPITSFFVKSTMSADSDSTLIGSDSTQSFASVVQGRSFNASDYVSNSTVSHTILNSPPKGSTSKLWGKLDTLDDIEDITSQSIPHTTSCPDIPSTLDTLRSLGNDDKEDPSVGTHVALPPRLKCKPKRKKRKRHDTGGCNSSSESGSDSLPTINVPCIPRKSNDLGTNNTSMSPLLQADEGDGEEDYETVLARDIVVPQEAADSFRRTRGALVAEAKGQVRSQHLRAMSREGRIPRWALGLESAPAYTPTNRELHEEFAALIRRQAQERMALIAASLESKANYFRNIAEAGLKGIRHLYGRDKAGYKDCRSLLKALSTKDKVMTRKQMQKTEVSVGENPTPDEDIIKSLLAPQGDSGSSRPLTFRPRQPPKEPKDGKKKEDKPLKPRNETADQPTAGTSTGGRTPWGNDAIGGKKDKGKKRPAFQRSRSGGSTPRQRSLSPDSMSPSPKKKSPGSPRQEKKDKKGKGKDGRKPWDNRPRWGFRQGRPQEGRQQRGHQNRDQRPQNQERHPQEQMFLDAIARALDEMSRNDPTFRRRNQRKEE